MWIVIDNKKSFTFCFISFVIQVLCGSQNEHSSTAVEAGDREQEMFCQPAVEEKLSVELPAYRGQAQGNDFVLSCCKKMLKVLI